MTTEKATAAQPSTTPAADTSVAATTTTEASVEDRLFAEYSAKSDARLGESVSAMGIAAPDPDDPDLIADPGSVTEPNKETPAKAGVSTSEPGKTDAAATAAAPAKTGTESTAAATTEEPNDDVILASVAENLRPALKRRLDDERAAKKRVAELDAANKDLDQKFRSEKGRVAALEARAAKPAAPVKPVSAEAMTKAKAEFDAVKARYPEITKAIEAAFVMQGGDATNTKELLEYVAKQRDTAVLADAWAIVEKAHEGWRTDLKTPEFDAWIKTQPQKVQDWLDGDAQDAILLVDRFKASSSFKPRTAAAATDTTDPAKAKEAAEAAALAAKRDLQKPGAQTASSTRSSAPDTSADPNSVDAMFAQYARAADARLKAGGHLI